MEPNTFYSNQQTKHTIERQRIRRMRNKITASKLLIFIGIIWMVVRLVGDMEGDVWNWIGLGMGVVLFAVITVWDSRVLARILHLEALIRCCSVEKEYLDGVFTHLDPGSELLDPTHAYAHDLDLFGDQSLFQAINRTITTPGKERLCGWLLKPTLETTQIRERQLAVEELAQKMDWCLQFRAEGTLLSPTAKDERTIHTWLKGADIFTKLRERIGLYGLNVLTLSLVLGGTLGWISPTWSILLIVLQLALTGRWLKKINNLHRDLEGFSRAMESYLHLARVVHPEPFTAQVTRALKDRLETPDNALQAFAKLDRILQGFEQRNNVLVALLLNGLYLRDIHQLIRLEAWKRRHGHSVLIWVEALSEFDALISLATYRFNNPKFTLPQVSPQEPLLEATQLGHPQLRSETKVNNDFTIRELHQLVIVTGANMAGKSTFLRTVGVNLVLAMAGSVVSAQTLRCRPMELFTSMRTTDNLTHGTSYFHAELLRLKALQEKAMQGGPLFVILDEMLKGTNSHDKVNGSTLFLTRLRTLNVSGLVATHDLALGQLATHYPDNFQNACFEIIYAPGEDIEYDYLLKKGISQNMNASFLLQQMGLV